jgi:carbonic anhydrase
MMDEGTEANHEIDHETNHEAIPETAHNSPSAIEPSAIEQKPRVSSQPAPASTSTSTTESTAVTPPGLSSRHEEKHTAIEADQALKWLVNGNNRYVKKQYRADGRSAEDRKRLLTGQHPHAIVLSCADSRVPPEIVFDQMLGEIFTIRVAGEALDSSVIASVEYAVEHLHPRLLVVMGHTQCGAVEAVLKTKEGESAGSEALDKMIADIRPRLKSVPADKISPNLEVESTVNADGVARDLIRRSEIIRKKVEAGELVIKPALYRMDSGKVSFY